MFIPLGVKTDYSLLKSLIRIPNLMEYLRNKQITACGILDENLYGSMAFYDSCLKNNIKPIIGLIIPFRDNKIYLYAKSYEGYQNLLKIHTIKQQRDIQKMDLIECKEEIIGVVPYKAREYYEELKGVWNITYMSYSDDEEKKNSSLLSNNIVYIEEVCAFNFKDIKYIAILREIDTGEKIDLQDYKEAYLDKDVSLDDQKRTEDLANLINLEIVKGGRFIPHYDEKISDSFGFLRNLCNKGLIKRENGQVSRVYQQRLDKELAVIKKMGFVDYFLIVYDYVKYAKTHGILVGPGRGSAAGSLVSYCLGITNIDPLKYDLLFERFLNPERVTMPDIDIDFEYTKRDQVIDYVKNKYGVNKVANIMTFGTLGSRQVIRDVGKYFKVDTNLIDKLSNVIDPKLSLKDNLKNKQVKDLLEINEKLKIVYQVSFTLEGLKRHISIHAAGVVIASVDLDGVIPICLNEGQILTGCTMEYLEELGLLKMDFLALRNLTIIQNVLELIQREKKENINLNKISLDDKETMNIFKEVDTEGIFQFESSGMKNFLAKLKPDSFSDLIAAVALFRPGPMQNIDTFIRRKSGLEEVTYPVKELEDILKSTYGIMIYQEQIMLVLVKMADYSFAEADNIRRAMSKKKIEVMEKERINFVTRAMRRGYSKDKCEEVYDLILKFANYGFNKAHSVSYALIGYQMAYLKAHYPVYFIANLLNMSIGSDIKTKECIDEAKQKNILIYKPSINSSLDTYIVKDNSLLLPLNIIHNVGNNAVLEIIKEREENGLYKDFYNFVARTYGKSINRKTIEVLIDGDTFREFKINHQTLFKSIDSALDYAMLCANLDESLIIKPDYVKVREFSEGELMQRELNTYGFYITNHPASKYQEGVMKLKDITKYFDKYVTCVVIVENVKKIKTKNNEDMGFILGADETGSGDFIVFPRYNKYLVNIGRSMLVKVKGQVKKRVDKYQVVVSNVEILV